MTLQGAGLEVLQHHIGMLKNEGLETLNKVRIIKIGADTGFAIVHTMKQHRGAVHKGRPPVARVITPPMVFNLDDASTQPGQDIGRIRRREAVADLDHTRAAQRQVLRTHHGVRPYWLRAEASLM